MERYQQEINKVDQVKHHLMHQANNYQMYLVNTLQLKLV